MATVRNIKVPKIGSKSLRVLLTGSRGFIGQETEKLLKSLGIYVVGYDLMDGLDIRRIDQLEKVIKEHKPNRVLHLAALARFADADDNPKLAFDTNVGGTKTVVEVCKRHSLPIVYASTGSVYMPITEEPPIREDFKIRGNSVYGCSKAIGEMYVMEHIPHIILRYAHLYGKEKRLHGLIGGFMDRIDRGLAPTLYGGKQSNDFTYVKDIAMANYLALAATADKWNQAYNIGTGEELTAEEAGKILCRVVGYEGKTDKKEQRTVDPQRFVFDISKAGRLLGYKPKYTFEEGLEEMFPKRTRKVVRKSKAKKSAKKSSKKSTRKSVRGKN